MDSALVLRGELSTPLAHWHSEALFEDHLEVWDIGKTADAGDLGDGKLRRSQSLLDLFQPCSEDDFADSIALVFPKPQRGKRP